MKVLPVGIQLYTVRNKMAKDFKGTLQAIKNMGYDYVEFAGTFGKTGKEVREILDELGLKAISAHIAYKELLGDLEGTLKTYKEIGIDYVTIPYMAEGDRPGDPGFETVLENMVKIGKAVKNAGMVMLYHNHDFEFIKMPNGEYGLDYIYSTISADLLQTELDVCWVNIGGENPAEYIRKYAHRCPIVHLKDFVGQKSDHMYELIGIASDGAEAKTQEFAFRPVGHGVQNFPEILKAANESGAKYVVVEQDETYDIPCLEAAKMSRDYLKSLED